MGFHWNYKNEYATINFEEKDNCSKCVFWGAEAVINEVERKKRMKYLKKITAILLAMMMIFSLAACGSSDTAKEEGTTKEAAQQDGQTVYPYEAVDYLGTTYTIEKEPEKVISVSPSMTELIYALGAQDKLIGRSDYCDYPEEVSSVESVGSMQTPDVEKIISLDPDLVIVTNMIDEQVVTKLQDVGISVLTVVDVEDLSQVYDMITMVGAALNKNEEAATLVEESKATVAEVEEKTKDLEAPSVYYVVAYGEYGDSVPGGDTFIHGIITAAGGDNIGKDITGWSINLEEIIEKDPDIIIIPSYYDGAFQEADHYKDLTAVKEGRVYVIDNNMIDRQGARTAEGIRALAEIFHPEAFK